MMGSWELLPPKTREVSHFAKKKREFLVSYHSWLGRTGHSPLRASPAEHSTSTSHPSRNSGDTWVPNCYYSLFLKEIGTNRRVIYRSVYQGLPTRLPEIGPCYKLEWTVHVGFRHYWVWVLSGLVLIACPRLDNTFIQLSVPSMQWEC